MAVTNSYKGWKVSGLSGLMNNPSLSWLQFVTKSQESHLFAKIFLDVEKGILNIFEKLEKK